MAEIPSSRHLLNYVYNMHLILPICSCNVVCNVCVILSALSGLSSVQVQSRRASAGEPQSNPGLPDLLQRDQDFG